MLARSRQCDRDRIVANNSLGAARCRHQGAGITQRNADATGLGRLPRITSCSAEMKAVAHRHDAGGKLPSLADRNRHGLNASELAESVACIENDRTLTFRYDRSGFIAGHGTFL